MNFSMDLNQKQAKYVQTIIQINQIYLISHFQMLRNFSPCPNFLSTAEQLKSQQFIFPEQAPYPWVLSANEYLCPVLH